MKQLTSHFWLHEFTSSQTAARMGREIVPTESEEMNITRLCALLLEPMRAALRLPFVITSGLRPAWLNEAIGGSKTSSHMAGLAADVKVIGMSPVAFTRWVQTHAPANGWPIDQCILEFPPNGWTHLSIADVPRQQFLTAKNQGGRTVYLPGIAA